jgi:hypothetical protein
MNRPCWPKAVVGTARLMFRPVVGGIRINARVARLLVGIAAHIDLRVFGQDGWQRIIRRKRGALRARPNAPEKGARPAIVPDSSLNRILSDERRPTVKDVTGRSTSLKFPR